MPWWSNSSKKDSEEDEAEAAGARTGLDGNGAERGEVIHNEPTETTSLLSRSVSPPLSLSRRTLPAERETPPSIFAFGRVKFLHLLLLLLLAVSVVFTLLTGLNTSSDLSPYLPPSRSTTFLPFWLSVTSTYILLSNLIFFTTPSTGSLLSTYLATLLALTDVILLAAVADLRHRESWLGLSTALLVLASLALVMVSEWVVRDTKLRVRVVELEEARFSREAYTRLRTSDSWPHKAGRFILKALSMLLSFLGTIVLFLLTVNLILRAYDASTPLPSPTSQRVSIRPYDTQTSYNVHIDCAGPTTLNGSRVPTVMFESASGVPGTVGAQWLRDMQNRGETARLCYWDRPGYGFSENAPASELAHVSEALHQALNKSGEFSQSQSFLLVGQGYGGLVTRTFSSMHPQLTSSLLHIDAQTPQLYFAPPRAPRYFRWLPLAFRQPVHRIFARWLPAVTTPLGIRKWGAMLGRGETKEGRTLATRKTRGRNEALSKALLQETYLSHDLTSLSRLTLLDNARTYPRKAPAIVLSSSESLARRPGWEAAQRDLATQVTHRCGLVRWDTVEGGHDLCKEGEGRRACEQAVKDLLNREN